MASSRSDAARLDGYLEEIEAAGAARLSQGQRERLIALGDRMVAEEHDHWLRLAARRVAASVRRGEIVTWEELQNRLQRDAAGWQTGPGARRTAQRVYPRLRDGATRQLREAVALDLWECMREEHGMAKRDFSLSSRRGLVPYCARCDRDWTAREVPDFAPTADLDQAEGTCPGCGGAVCATEPIRWDNDWKNWGAPI